MFIFGRKGYGAQGVKHILSTTGRKILDLKMSEFLQVIRNKKQEKNPREKYSLAHNIRRGGELMMTTFAGNGLKMTITITTSTYSALIKRKIASIP